MLLESGGKWEYTIHGERYNKMSGLTLGAHAQRGLVCVCVCVCVRRSILAPRAITRQTRNTSDFSVTWAVKIKRRFVLIERLPRNIRSAILSHVTRALSVYLVHIYPT